MLRSPLSTAGLILAVLILITAPASAAPKAAARTVCDIDVVPAATLLIPYFESEPAAADPTRGTLVAVTNVSTRPRVAHVTLWTDWAIPTVSFDMVLRPNDIQTFDVRDILRSGPPATQVAYPGCTGPLTPGLLYFNPGIPKGATPAEGLSNVAKAHTGEPFPATGQQYVASSNSHPGLAVGYITVDVTNRCFDGFPSTKDYFKAGGTGVASNDAALVGDVVYSDDVNGGASAEPAVHIRTSTGFKKGDYTFYGRFTFPSATDGRQPLGNTYGSRFWVEFAPDPAINPQTDMLVWRDTKSVWTAPVPLNTEPYWCAAMTTPQLITFDEQSHSDITRYNFEYATQRVPVDRDDGIDVGYNAGWIRINLNHQVPYDKDKATSLFGARAQGWVTTLFSANVAGSPAAGAFRAYRLGTVCVQR